jgi:hypothetical protein
MDKKKILIIAGVVAVAGVGLYLWSRSRKSNETVGSESVGATSESETKKIASETSQATTKEQGQNIKDLKGKVKREFRKETRDVCAEKYGKGLFNKKYNDCKKRVKKGGIAFDGTSSFEGGYESAFGFTEFENNLNLDL